jgi:hypothetical protein
MGRRLFAILVWVLILWTLLPNSPSVTQTLPLSSLVSLSPPDNLELPVGQRIQVCCHLQSTIGASLEFQVDGVVLDSRDVPAGGAAAWGWAPSKTGRHIIHIVARINGRQVAALTTHILAVAATSPVRIP